MKERWRLEVGDQEHTLDVFGCVVCHSVIRASAYRALSLSHSDWIWGILGEG